MTIFVVTQLVTMADLGTEGTKENNL